MALFFLQCSPPIINLMDFPMVSPLSSLHIYTVCECVCSFPFPSQMLGCEECVNLGLVGSLSHDLVCAGLCLLSASSSDSSVSSALTHQPPKQVFCVTVDPLYRPRLLENKLGAAACRCRI